MFLGEESGCTGWMGKLEKRAALKVEAWLDVHLKDWTGLEWGRG